MPKYIEVPKIDENKERAKKKISFLLVLVSVCITAGVGFTIAGFGFGGAFLFRLSVNW